MDSTPTPTDAKLREVVFIALGKASMCWSETPTGVFDSDRAIEIGNEVMQALASRLAPVQAELERYKAKHGELEDAS